jgi:hypothetical protein
MLIVIKYVTSHYTSQLYSLIKFTKYRDFLRFQILMICLFIKINQLRFTFFYKNQT